MKALIKSELSKGKLLISKPLINDDFFHHSVVFLTEYTEDGIVGFIVNKPINLDLHDLIEEFPKFDTQVYYGGPVASDNLYFIHRVPEKIEGSIHITDDLFWGGNFTQVIELIKNDQLNTDDIRFFLGYSGWDVEQLDQEINEDSWIVDEMDDSLFNWDIVQLWKNRLNTKGDKFQIWSNAPKDIRLN